MPNPQANKARQLLFTKKAVYNSTKSDFGPKSVSSLNWTNVPFGQHCGTRLQYYISSSLDISSTLTEPCCALKYYPEIEICVKEQKGEQEAKRKEAQRLEDENFGTHIIGRIRTYLWNLFEYPETSREAQVSILVYLNLYSRSHRP